MPLVIRPAHPDDALALADIMNAIVRAPHITFTTVEKSPADVAAMIDARHRDGFAMLVADEDGAVLGFAATGPFRAGPGYRRTMEVSFNLAEGARGKGVGTKLLTAIEAHGRDAGAHVFVAGISGANPAALGFFGARGFVEVGRLAETGYKGGRYLDLVFMQKTLTGL